MKAAKRLGGDSLTRYAVLLLAVILLMFSACEKKEESGKITIIGSGATFPQPQIEKWIDEYSKINPSVKIEYTGKGSGAGQNDFKNGLVDFACSDPPIKEKLWKELEKQGKPLQFPIIIGAIAVVYNLPNVDDLNLSRDVLVDIFLGKIEYWDDPRIKEINPNANLPHEKIIVVHRSDSSGTTAVFTAYLSKISSEWENSIGSGKVVDWPADKIGRGLGGKGNQGVAAIIKQTPYTIGYVELAYAIKENLKIASIENKDGNFVKPTKETIKEAVSMVSMNFPKPTEGYKEDIESFLDAPGSMSYPIIAFSHMIVWSNYEDKKAEALREFIKWIMTAGQRDENILTGYVGLPKEVAKIGLEAAEMIK